MAAPYGCMLGNFVEAAIDLGEGGGGYVLNDI